ncbi:hypothetical protein D9M73_266320 [compost metagenome]
MDLRFGGACADRGPGQQVVEVAGSHRLQQLGSNRQAAFDHVQHQPARQGDTRVHVVTAIEVRVVGQAFPAHCSTRFFDVGTHHQQHLVADFSGQAGKLAGVFKS